MMKKGMVIILLSAVLLILPGCWNKEELDESGFAMAIALDQGKGGTLDLTTQIYRPSNTKGASSGSGTKQTKNLLIRTSDDSLLEAIRDIPLHLGRKAKWSHLRIILVGEKLAAATDVGKLIDLFYRDHEPRHTVSIMIAKGRAEKILEKKPEIEQTIGQQLMLTKQVSFKSSAKSMDTTLLKLALQMNSPQGDASITYVYEDKKKKDVLNSAGLALIKKGKMTGILSPKKVEGLVMLRNEIVSGAIEVPCPGKKFETESLEILSFKTKLKPKLKGNKVSVQVKSQVQGAVGELKCTNIKTKKDEAEFTHKMEEQIKHQMLETAQFLQKKKSDIIGIGNKIAGAHPKQWNKMKEGWDEQYAKIPFDIQVKLQLVTTGTVIGKPTVSGEDR